MHLKPPPQPIVLTPITRTPNITPPRESIAQTSPMSEDVHSDDDYASIRSDSPEKKPFDFVAFSQELLGVVQSNTQRCENLGFQQKKTNLDIENFKIHLANLQKEHQDLIKKLKANEELATLLSEEQQLFDTALKKLQETPQSHQSLASETPQRNNSKVSQLKKRFSGENILPTPSILRNPTITQELTQLKSLNVLGNPETDDTSSNEDQNSKPQHIAESSSKMELLQQQVLQMTSEIGELSNKAKTYEERSKNLDLDQLILKKLSSLGLSNFSESIALQEESATLKEEAEKRNLERIARLERTVFFQWIGGGIITLLLLLKIQRK